MFAKRYFGIPYAYDLDSSIAQQMVESRPGLSGLARGFDGLEATLIREALVTFPVCNALADLCRSRGAERVVTLHDISQLEEPGAPRSGELRREFGITEDQTLVLYTGNFEPYQGVELLLEAFSVAASSDTGLRLLLIGGNAGHVRTVCARIEALGLSEIAFAPGPRPFEHLGRYLADADILACPRIRGVNTPMKVFPYLHSGRPVVATRLPTHTQLLTDDEAMLAPATPAGFADALVELAGDPERRTALGAAGQAFVERHHTYEAHRDRLNAAYDWIEEALISEAG